MRVSGLRTLASAPELRIPAILNIPLGAGTEEGDGDSASNMQLRDSECSGLACTGTSTSTGTGTGTGTGAGTGKAAVLQQALRHISLLLLLLLLFAARLAARLPVYPLPSDIPIRAIVHRPSSIAHRGDEGSASRRPCCPIAPRRPVEHVSNIHHSSQQLRPPPPDTGPSRLSRHSSTNYSTVQSYFPPRASAPAPGFGPQSSSPPPPMRTIPTVLPAFSPMAWRAGTTSHYSNHAPTMWSLLPLIFRTRPTCNNNDMRPR